MATISENLIILNDAKQSIKVAIENKGQDLTGVPFTEYASKIEKIQSGSSVTIITEYNDESSLPKNPKENDVCILNSSNLRTWVYFNGAWVEYPILINEEVNESGGFTLIITNNSLKEEVNEEGGTTLIIGG